MAESPSKRYRARHQRYGLAVPGWYDEEAMQPVPLLLRSADHRGRGDLALSGLCGPRHPVYSPGHAALSRGRGSHASGAVTALTIAMLASGAPRAPISRRGLIKTGRHQREISGETVTECLRPYLGALFPKRALLRRQRREASVRLKVADQGISALQSDLANGLNIIGHDGNNGQTYNPPTDAPVTAARDSLSSPRTPIRPAAGWGQAADPPKRRAASPPLAP